MKSNIEFNHISNPDLGQIGQRGDFQPVSQRFGYEPCTDSQVEFGKGLILYGK